jgi:hypothetical protein
MSQHGILQLLLVDISTSQLTTCASIRPRRFPYRDSNPKVQFATRAEKLLSGGTKINDLTDGHTARTNGSALQQEATGMQCDVTQESRKQGEKKGTEKREPRGRPGEGVEPTLASPNKKALFACFAVKVPGWGEPQLTTPPELTDRDGVIKVREMSRCLG